MRVTESGTSLWRVRKSDVSTNRLPVRTHSIAQACTWPLLLHWRERWVVRHIVSRNAMGNAMTEAPTLHVVPCVSSDGLTHAPLCPSVHAYVVWEGA